DRVINTIKDCPIVCFGFFERLLGFLARGDVAQDNRKQPVAVQFGLGTRGFDRKFLAISPSPIDAFTCSNQELPYIPLTRITNAPMDFAEPLPDQSDDQLS